MGKGGKSGLLIAYLKFSSILVNGTPSGFFNSSWGLRQDPPPLLFVIFIEALSHMMVVAVNGGFIFGFSVGGRSDDLVSVSHFHFADDTLIFSRSALDQIQYLRCVLCLEAASGLKTNLAN